MPQYYNYSPEIPNSDEPQEVPQQEPEREPEERPSKRKRNVRRQSQNQSKEAGVKDSVRNKGSERPENSGKPFFSQVNEWLSSTVTRAVLGIILGGLGFWFAVAFISYFSSCIADQSAVMNAPVGEMQSVSNDAGEGGARLTELLINQGFGLGAIVIVVWLICMSLKLLIRYPRFRTLDFTIKSLIAFITLSVVVGMLSIGLDTDVNWGGFHGRIINEKIYEFIGWSGAIILSVVLISIFVVICLRDVIKWIIRKKRIYDERRRIQREALEAERQKEEEMRKMERNELKEQALSGEGADPDQTSSTANPEEAMESVEFDPESDTLFDIPDLEDEEETTLTDIDLIASGQDSLQLMEEPIEAKTIDYESKVSGASVVYDATEPVETPAMPAEEYPAGDESAAVVAPDSTLVSSSMSSMSSTISDEPEMQAESSLSDAPPSSSDSDLQEEDPYDEPAGDISKNEEAYDEDEQQSEEDVMTVNVNQIEKGSDKQEPTYDTGLFTHEYRFPSPEYLLPGSDKISVDADEQMENKEKIKKTLLDFGIPITSIEATVGPTVTLYEIRPDTGVKIAKIRNLVDDIALSLAAIGVRIIAPIPGKGTVGIEVANKDPQTVSMRTIIQSKVYQNSKYKLPVALGSTISNDVYIADLAKMPHLLVAGATGQGKSVGLNAIVTSLLYSKRPEELKFVMVDPKRVEFSLYSKIEKYYLAKIPDSPQPIITNMENVVATLSSLCVEMDERYKLLEKAFVRQVSEYNEKFRAKKLNPAEGHRFMPYIVVIIDEFADLIMTAGKEVELPIARLAQLARAVGIHVIIATQRPSTNVITGMIKANFPVRIAFKVSSGVDSKTILDSTGAQQLIGRGDMLISNNGEMVRVQCAFVDTPEVEEICDYIARQPYPQGPYILPEPQVGGEGESSEMDPAAMGKKDPLLEEVARQVVMSGTASTSAVQRRYEIGYNRAGRIMDQLEALGVVGPATGGKPRNVLVDGMTLEDILSSLNQ